MVPKPDARGAAARLSAHFQAAGAELVEADILLPAATLLDLYGEEIRARAYVTHDPLRGEQMLRPDFTVPVVERHMREGAEPARYTYAGEVFRRQEEDTGRPSEYLQVGYEVFDRDNPAAADAEVFALFAEAMGEADLHAVTGDIGFLLAAVRGLSTSERRRDALLRHVWRPRRFRSLLDRFAGRRDVPGRTKLLALIETNSIDDLLDGAGPAVGLRGVEEVLERLEVIRADANEPPISAGEAEVLETLLGLRETAPNALETLKDIAVDVPAIGPAIATLEARLEAMATRGVDVTALDFDLSHGRSSMEYYDGFVFSFAASGRADLPPVATGGRYDALTERLGDGRSIPAVGGVIRPEILLAVGGAA